MSLVYKNALVSVADKTGLVEFLRPFVEKGLKIVSTGGTAKHLRANNIEVSDVSELTKFPEVMDGRVKTLHPRIHMSLLARESVGSDMKLLKDSKLEPFDLVIGNLYAFEDALTRGVEDSELCEFIDIGGPSFLRASAKNYSRIAVFCDPDDYPRFSEKGELTLEDRKGLAAKVFSHISSYDSMVAQALGSSVENIEFSQGGKSVLALRYGENPQQKASWYRVLGEGNGLHKSEVLQGKPLSYNNILDLDAACSTLNDLNFEKVCVAVKHNNPCGVCVGESLEKVVDKALKADPVSVFGGIVATNCEVNLASAEALRSLFLECIIAPKFSSEALGVLGKKKNLRLLQWSQMSECSQKNRIKSVLGGFLVQESDKLPQKWNEEWEVYGEEPTQKIKQDLLLAWNVCAHLKSNGIALVADSQTVGLGMGQVNRVDAVDQAIGRWKNFHPQLSSVVMASDAFFPFPDSIEKAAEAGIRWIIQPGGSIKDSEVKAKAQSLNVNLVITGRRHFLH